MKQFLKVILGVSLSIWGFCGQASAAFRVSDKDLGVKINVFAEDNDYVGLWVESSEGKNRIGLLSTNCNAQAFRNLYLDFPRSVGRLINSYVRNLNDESGDIGFNARPGSSVGSFDRDGKQCTLYSKKTKKDWPNDPDRIFIAKCNSCAPEDGEFFCVGEDSRPYGKAEKLEDGQWIIALRNGTNTSELEVNTKIFLLIASGGIMQDLGRVPNYYTCNQAVLASLIVMPVLTLGVGLGMLGNWCFRDLEPEVSSQSDLESSEMSD